MTKNTYNPYEIMMDKYDKEEMLSDVREAMLYQLGVDVSCEELNHFFHRQGQSRTIWLCGVAAVLCSRKDAGVLLYAYAGRDSG